MASSDLPFAAELVLRMISKAFFSIAATSSRNLSNAAFVDVAAVVVDPVAGARAVDAEFELAAAVAVVVDDDED
jgi:hypothetical protein